jgi:hypothetical protein
MRSFGLRQRRKGNFIIVVFVTERSEVELRGNGRVVARPEIKYVCSVQGPSEVYK